MRPLVAGGDDRRCTRVHRRITKRIDRLLATAPFETAPHKWDKGGAWWEIVTHKKISTDPTNPVRSCHSVRRVVYFRNDQTIRPRQL